jgi:hypothetical protein
MQSASTIAQNANLLHIWPRKLILPYFAKPIFLAASHRNLGQKHLKTFENLQRRQAQPWKTAAIALTDNETLRIMLS